MLVCISAQTPWDCSGAGGDNSGGARGGAALRGSAVTRSRRRGRGVCVYTDRESGE